MKEKYTYTQAVSNIKVEENEIISFDKINTVEHSFRVHSDGFVGVQYCEGSMDEDEGYKKANEKLALKRPYKFELETGVRHRDKTEKTVSDKELMDMTRTALEHIRSKYPDFTLKGGFSQNVSCMLMENEKGLDYSNRDCTVNASFSYKHKDSKDIYDGYFSIGQRDFDMDKLYSMADNFLGCFNELKELPDEIIIQNQYYEYLNMLKGALDAEELSLGTSILSGKIGEKVFSDNFTLIHDVSDKECWHTCFFDGDGVTLENDTLTYIKNGVILRGYADKKIADKYGVEHTGSAYRDFADIPSNGNVNLRIERSNKTIKELLDGRLSVVPVQYSGGGFNEKGEYTMPVQLAYLCDGEKFLGKLPPFTLVSNMFDMFGKDFIGVGSDDPVFYDKQILVRMKLGKIGE
ncbi:MAG: hypothetical protein IJ446_09945 [Oscillospiraceae bacterium]|nr:hypothetical protein [Oscillospiraceae bacterium]